MNAPVSRPDALPPQAIALSPEERARGQLTPENRALAGLILSCRGYVVLQGALEPEFVAELRAEFEAIYLDCRASLGAAETDTAAEAIQRVHVSAERRASFWFRKSRFRIFPRLVGPMGDPRLLANPFALPVLEDLLGKALYCQYVSSDTCVRGALLQSPHSDIAQDDVLEGGAWRARCYIVNVPIVECGLHNGPIEVWPGGSHMWSSALFERYGLAPYVQDGRNPPVERVAAYFPSIKLVLHPGEVLIRDPAMWHRGTPSGVDEPRTMMTTAYFRGGYRYGYGDLAYNVDRGIWRGMDPQVKRLFDHHFSLPASLRRRQKQLRSAAKRAAVGWVKGRLGQGRA